MDKIGDHITEFLGFIHMFFHVTVDSLSLKIYQDKDRLIDFIGFLQFRGCHSPHLVKHLDIAKRVLEFIDTCEGMAARGKKKLRLDARWSDNLVRDIKKVTPKRRPLANALPPAIKVFEFIGSLTTAAKTRIASEAKRFGPGLGTADTAWMVQLAVIGMMVTGTHTPPSRLSALKSAQHPNKLGATCPIAGCRNPTECKGNRFEVLDDGDRGGKWTDDKAALREGQWESDMEDVEGEEGVSVTPKTSSGSHLGGSVAATTPAQRQVAYRVPHHKNTLRGFDGIQYIIPKGDLTDLLLYHIDVGSRHLVKEPSRSLFASANQSPFTDGTFTRYWEDKVLAGAPFEVFPPSKGRDIFVAAFVKKGLPCMQDGAAAVRTGMCAY